jgi:hypothetical protein
MELLVPAVLSLRGDLECAMRPVHNGVQTRISPISLYGDHL